MMTISQDLCLWIFIPIRQTIEIKTTYNPIELRSSRCRLGGFENPDVWLLCDAALTGARLLTLAVSSPRWRFLYQEISQPPGRDVFLRRKQQFGKRLTSATSRYAMERQLRYRIRSDGLFLTTIMSWHSVHKDLRKIFTAAHLFLR